MLPSIFHYHEICERKRIFAASYISLRINNNQIESRLPIIDYHLRLFASIFAFCPFRLTALWDIYLSWREFHSLLYNRHTVCTVPYFSYRIIKYSMLTVLCIARNFRNVCERGIWRKETVLMKKISTEVSWGILVKSINRRAQKVRTVMG